MVNSQDNMLTDRNLPSWSSITEDGIYCLLSVYTEMHITIKGSLQGNFYMHFAYRRLSKGNMGHKKAQIMLHCLSFVKFINLCL